MSLSTILLYLDQGEELYTHAPATQARRFSEALAQGLGERRLLAFASLRANYFDRLQADEPLFNCHQHINVPPLDRAQLHEVVTAPSRDLDVTFEDTETANRRRVDGVGGKKKKKGVAGLCNALDRRARRHQEGVVQLENERRKSTPP